MYVWNQFSDNANPTQAIAGGALLSHCLFLCCNLLNYACFVFCSDQLYQNQRRYNKDPTTKLGTFTMYTRCLAQLRLPSVVFLIKTCTKASFSLNLILLGGDEVWGYKGQEGDLLSFIKTFYLHMKLQCCKLRTFLVK